MTRRFRTRLGIGLGVLACVGLASCGSSTPSNQSSATTSPPPGPGDNAICQMVSKAATAYNAKDYTSWRADLAQIGTMSGSAQYLPIKRIADGLNAALSSGPTTTTVTTAKHGKYKPPNLTQKMNQLFGPIGAYVTLQKTCAHLPS